METKKNIYLGNTQIKTDKGSVNGAIVEVGETPFYQIEDYDRMPRFLITIASAYDHWLFISTGGNVTCGRVSPENAIFPYQTDDKLHESSENAGAKTVFLVSKDERCYLWEPFVDKHAFCYDLTRSISKSIYGNRLRFEEVNRSLGLTYVIEWTSSNQFGIVRRAFLSNSNEDCTHVEVLDGFVNILPPGADRRSLDALSPLIDAYKMGELQDGRLGVFHLSSILSGNPEPVEALKGIVAYSYGLDVENHLLSTRQLESFTRGEPVSGEEKIRGIRPGYFVHSRFSLAGGEGKSWGLVIDCDYTPVKVEGLKKRLAGKTSLESEIVADIEHGTKRLKTFLEKADGLQKTEDLLSSYKHTSNTMFNIMRGGTYVDGYTIPIAALKDHLVRWNRDICELYSAELDAMNPSVTKSELIEWAEAKSDNTLLRLCYEFLPLTFSRRHGDPSRPWNSFAIHVQDEAGNDRLSYQGNWRDIFQNWEALSLSYPEFIENIILKFANGITADGYNSIGISSDGVSWESLMPGQEMTRVGYSGDHQVIYFLKLLELSTHYHPGKLAQLLDTPLCVYPNVSFRIKSFEELVKNPRRSLFFDYESEAAIKEKVEVKGSDGKLHCLANGSIVEVSLLEKILSVLLSKLSNFVPNGGIWMNTQRPEWNDANSALVGWGLSAVTMCYLRRFMVFLAELLKYSKADSYTISQELADFLQVLAKIFSEYEDDLVGEVGSKERKAIWEALGRSGASYRDGIYKHGFEGKNIAIERGELVAFCEGVIAALDASIHSLERDDGMFHSYNLLQLNGDGISIKTLSEMLEGQVAVLASGVLGPDKVNRLLSGLEKSKLYRKDQHSFILYPDKELPEFTEKSKIPESLLRKSPFLLMQLDCGSREIIERDGFGNVHFSHTLSGSELLEKALDRLRSKGFTISTEEGETILGIFKEVYRHEEYLGRSQSVFKYEGLGSIYWHMVSKLLLEVQQNYFKAVELKAEDDTIEALFRQYYSIRKGLSHEKKPDVYGAFVLDAYSHTPSFCGAQQPGMTGQVKEDIISRFGELGVSVRSGILGFNPIMLRKHEWSSMGTLCFSYCGIPVRYVKSAEPKIVVHFRNEPDVVVEGSQLSVDLSRRIFERDETICEIEAHIL